ncbi:unnamed protein product [Boreogadus saida]
MQQRAPRFKGYQQQDSQELLHYLLDSIRVEETKVFFFLLWVFGKCAKPCPLVTPQPFLTPAPPSVSQPTRDPPEGSF